MQDSCGFSAAFRLVSGNEVAHQESDETGVLKTSESVSPGSIQYLDQGNEADQRIDYDPLRLIKLPLATIRSTQEILSHVLEDRCSSDAGERAYMCLSPIDKGEHPISSRQPLDSARLLARTEAVYKSIEMRLDLHLEAKSRSFA